MTHNTLQSLIWPASELCSEQALYARLSGARQHRASLEFNRDDSASFNTYFNLFNLGKWRLHCGLKSLSLGLAGQGVFMLEVFLTRANLPDETLLFPGHLYAPEPSSSIGEQKQTNPFLRVARLEDFLAFMGL